MSTGQYVHEFGSNHDGHWNETGHRIAAKLTAQFLKNHHIIPLEDIPK
jgi:hypothetical protein